MQLFPESHWSKNLIKEPKCFKYLGNSRFIDLILKNSTSGFQHLCAIQTSLSDFHKMTVTVMKATFQKLAPEITHYRVYKNC